jgi:hypothetical protein
MAVVKRRPVPTTKDKETEVKIVEGQGENLDGIPIKRGSFIAQLKQEQEKNKLEKEVEDNMNKENMQEELMPVDNQREDKEEIRMDKIQESNKNYNLEMFQPALSVTTSRGGLQAVVMSVVNSNCGKRVTLSKELMDKLRNPTMVAVSFSKESIAIGEMLPNNNNRLTIKPSGKKGVIYSAGIVSEITDKYRLDFNNRTSITFSEVDFIEVEGSIIAIINAKKAN